MVSCSTCKYLVAGKDAVEAVCQGNVSEAIEV